MYRRNITHILVLMGSVLALGIGYHLFLKSSIQTGSTPTEAIETVPPPPPPPTVTLPLPETTSVRTIDHTVIPKFPHASLLETIRDDIEKHNLPLAETQLTGLPPALLDDARAKSFVAVLWNNLGLQQEHLHGTQISIKAFKKAAALDDSNPVILMNLVHAFWEQRDPALHQGLLEKLIRLAPEEPFPHLAMADLLHEQGQSTEAAHHLAHAADRVGKDPALQSYLVSIREKIHRIESVESRMATRSSAHFTVKFDGIEDQGTWTTVLDILEEAYRDIGQKFGHFPSKPIVVVLHTKESFQGMTGTPAWADGLYDPTLGRIQIPTQGATTNTQWLTNVLRHEYVHALLHDRLGFSAGALPTWLNEGLAMQWAGDDWPELDQTMRGEVTVIPLRYLEGSWGTLPGDAATLAYQEATSATRYLIERWGMTQVNELLKAFKARASVSTAIQNKLFVSYEQFHQQWLDSFWNKHS